MADPRAVLVLYNRPRGGRHAESDAGVIAEVAGVQAALREAGFTPREAGVADLSEIPPLLARSPEPVVFNLVEELPGSVEDVNLVPGICRAMGKAVTGAGSACLSLALHKGRAKAVLAAAGVPVPPGVLVEAGRPVPALDFPGPYFVKPVSTDASEGIDAETSFHREAGAALDGAVASLHAAFGQPVLVERYVGDRELNVAMLEVDGVPRVLAVAEISFQGFPEHLPRVVDYAAKWQPESERYRCTRRVVPAPLDPAVEARVRDVAGDAWRALGCAGYARVDLRLGADCDVAVLEVNPNPDVAPDAGFAAALAAAGLDMGAFVTAAIRAARGVRARQAVELRPTVASDRDAILDLLAATGFFPAHELDVAREVLDEAIARGPGGHYRSWTALLDDVPVGWVAWGPTPCTVATWDVYWLGVAPATQGRGVGRALVCLAEERIAAEGGRLVVIETSGRALYAPTQGFYERLGYTVEARIADFYGPGDDRLIFTRRVGG